MNENNELLMYIYQNCKMGTNTITTLIRTINEKDNKIKKVAEGILKGYERFLKDSEKLLRQNKVTPKEKGLFANMGSYMGIKMELLKDNSDARIADMLTKGMTMGVVEITKRLDNYKDDADRGILNLAKKLNKFQEESIQFLKPFL